MKSILHLSGLILGVLTMARGADAVTPSAEETNAALEWVNAHFAAASSANGFSFFLDGQASDRILGQWRRTFTEEAEVAGKVRRVVSLSDPAAGLEAVWTCVYYPAHAAVELLLELRNNGPNESPLIERVRPLDWAFVVNAWPCALHRALGESNSAKSFAPVRDLMPRDRVEPLVFAPNGGRSSDGHMPFFNLEWDGGGAIIAIGWAGQWEARFQCEEGQRVRVGCGMQTTHLRLHPGESIRTPRVLLQFWRGGEALRGNNLFRQWMLACNLPRRNGELVLAPICASVNQTDPDGSYEGPHVRVMNTLAERGIEVFWSDMDPQQWYPGGFPNGTGTWEPDLAKYPRGLKPIGDAAHAAGLEYLLWFEPERATTGSRIEREHPEWIARGEPFHLFRLDIPEARAWLTDYIDKQISEAGLGWIRWDFNIEALGYWRKNDAPDRQGITEIRHVEGLYAMWQELMRRHPGLIVDVCASGGRRIDFETLRYGLPLWHSDRQCFGPDPAADQLQNAGLFLWLPLHGCGNFGYEPSYLFRSAMTTGNILVHGNAQGFLDTADPDTAELVKNTVAIYHKLRPFMLGDFYPLFPHDERESVWYGYQFHQPDRNAGCALLFRRKDSPDARADIALQALNPDGQYIVTFEDRADLQDLSGDRIRAFPVEIPDAPGTAILYYHAL